MDYTGIPEHVLVHAFYDNTCAVGNGIYADEARKERPVTVDEIAGLLRRDHSGIITIDYLFGRPLKLDRVGTLV